MDFLRLIAPYFLTAFCISFSFSQSTLDGQLRDLVGIDVQAGTPQNERRAVILLASNASDSNLASVKTINNEDLIALALEMEDRDPNSLFVHFNGDNLVSSQPVLFNDLETMSAVDTWRNLLEKVGTHKPGKKSPVADLLVFQAYPDFMSEQVSKLCDSLYGKGKCEFVTGQIADSLMSSSRFRRAAADETTTPTPAPPNPSSILPVMPYTAAFQLLFWTTLAIALAVYGVSYAMWNMDPGRDSIIYRMTSAQKYKKDK